ncbi:putative transcriptional regulator [Evansella vedderi]|uniref:Transcriptional regulator n=1 Tax=Evansella vedderi TaxID=38282 RepID=A0ABU0A4J8_9BACI|nr:helix-turn-helix transcriptional regulator [Evansella vedderi]MDQ0257952.1 putative transcriptional regulator [Evansella vedderi]
MAITNNLRIIMAKKKIDSVSELMLITHLSRNALNKLYHDEDIDTVKLGTLIKLCDSLNVPLSELLEYTPEENSTH